MGHWKLLPRNTHRTVGIYEDTYQINSASHFVHYNLNDPVNQYRWIYMEFLRGMYGQPQVVILANNLPAQNLSNHGYYQVKQTPGLCRNVWRPI